MLGAKRELALLFKGLATLRSSAEVIRDVEDMRWHGPRRHHRPAQSVSATGAWSSARSRPRGEADRYTDPGYQARS